MKILTALLIGLVISTANISAQTSAFTYQGRLTDAAAPANAQYDFVFRLFDAAAGGSQVGGDVTLGDVQVTNGIFTVNLDFGATSFTPGAERYLQISVRLGTSSGAYTALSPMQAITSSPFSIKAANASSSDSLSAACVSCVTDANIDTVSAGKVSGVLSYSQGGTGIGPAPRPVGTFLRSTGSGWQANGLLASDIPVNLPGYIQNTTTTQASSNFSISGTGRATIFNANSQYNIGGQRVLSSPSGNLFVGEGAGTSNGGGANSFLGTNAGYSNTSGYFNSFVGNGAGVSNTEGHGNSFVGANAGAFNTIGTNNSFFGTSAGFNNDTGFSNAFFGREAGRASTTGSANSFFGDRAGYSNTTGGGNSYFGNAAGSGNSTSGGNSIFGDIAGTNNTGGYNSFFGRSSGSANTIGGDNAFFGSSSGEGNTTGSNNTNVGVQAGFTNTTGSNNTMIGWRANVATNNLSYATAIGAEAVVSSSDTVVLGRAIDTVQIPGAFNVSGNGIFSGTLTTTSIGSPTGTLTITGTTSDILLINRKVTMTNEFRANSGILTHSIDSSAAGLISLGSNNATSVQIGGTGTLANPGPEAIKLNGKTMVMGTLSTPFGGLLTSNIDTPGSGSLSIGSSNATAVNINKPTTITGLLTANGAISSSGNLTSAGTLSGNLVNTDTQYNSGGNRILGMVGTSLFVGPGGGSATTTSGASNTFVGLNAGLSNTSGQFNSFFGTVAGPASVGHGNSIFGAFSGLQNTFGNDNSFFGLQAGENNTEGVGNSFFGRSAGADNVIGFGNTIIGSQANVGGPNLDNATAIGAGALVSQSNSLVLGSGANVGIGTSAPQQKLHVNGDEILSTGTAAGFKFRDRGSMSSTDDWVWYSDGNVAKFFRAGVGNLVTVTTGGVVTVSGLGAAGSTSLCRNALNEISTCTAGNLTRGEDVDTLRQQITKQQILIDELKKIVCGLKPEADVCKEQK